MITKPIQNLTAVFTTFLLLVLPKLKEHISTNIKLYFNIMKKNPFQVRQANHKTTLSERLPYDPQKVTTTFKYLPNQKIIPDHNEFVKLYLSPIQQKDFDSIENCTDVRVLLIILAKAGCFSDVEATIGMNLKSYGNLTAHTQIEEFSDENTITVLNEVEKLLEILPNTNNEIRDLQQVKKYGAEALLTNRTGQQITAIRQSLERLGSGIEASVKASVEATITEQQLKIADVQLSEIKMGGRWSKLSATNFITCTSFELVSNSGRSSGLQSLISSKTPKFDRSDCLGTQFKIAEQPFAKGSSRIAYRGHFDRANAQIATEFKMWPEVVVKVSVEEASQFLKIQLYAAIFADEWNKLRGKDEIIFLWIKMVSLPNFEGTQTLEPCLNRKLYRKWYVTKQFTSYIISIISRSNNDGFVASGDNYEPILDAFSHWTYNESRGQMLVMDLQGVKQPSGAFWLTDPAIHSPTGDFGGDNKRALGIARFFETHRCNQICENLNLIKQK